MRFAMSALSRPSPPISETNNVRQYRHLQQAYIGLAENLQVAGQFAEEQPGENTQAQAKHDPVKCTQGKQPAHMTI